jgi:hypothetical protein
MGRAAAAEFGSGSCCDRRCPPGASGLRAHVAAFKRLLLDDAVAGALAATAQYGTLVDIEQLRRRLAGDVSVFVGDAAVLFDPDARQIGLRAATSP